MNQPGEVTALLESAAGGDREAFDRVFRLVYEDLRRVARRHLAGERDDHTLETAALVHEAYLRMVGLNRIEWRGRAHFFAAAAGAMRRILIDHALRRQTLKRGGDRAPERLDRVELAVHRRTDELLALDQALERLRRLDERQAKVVELRFFAGMSIDEVAEVLDVSTMTVKRDWTAARAWLNRELSA